MKRSIILTALAVAALASCNRIETPEVKDNVLDISVRKSVGTKTIVEGTTLPDGSEIGLFVTDQTGTTYDGVNLNNVKYTATGEGEAQKWNTLSNISLSASVANVCSYYPYNESVYDITAIPIEATSEVQTDWMWGTPVSGLDNKNYSATINMNHALAVIRLNLVKGNYLGTGNVTSVKIQSDGAGTSAILNAKTGALSSIKGANSDFLNTEEFILTGEGKVIDFIVVPTKIESPINIEVFINNEEMRASTSGINLEAGKIYEYSVSVGVEALQLNKLNVTEWIEGEVMEQMISPNIPKVNISGTTTNIRFEQTYANKTLTLKAIPTLEGFSVNEVTVKGGVLTQSVDENGIRTIVITDIISDITVSLSGTTYNEWARIQHVNGTLYTAEEWLAAEDAGTVTDADANGVAVRYSKYASCPHIIYPKYGLEKLSYGYGNGNTSGVCKTGSMDNARKEVNGKANTDALLIAVANGTLSNAPAAQYCVETVFANGQKGYLPAAGEVQAWFDNKTAVISCMDAIGGDEVDDRACWTSTQYDHKTYSNYAWFWSLAYSHYPDSKTRSEAYYVRAVTTFSY